MLELADVCKVVIGFDTKPVTTSNSSNSFEHHYKQIIMKRTDGSFVKDQML